MSLTQVAVTPLSPGVIISPIASDALVVVEQDTTNVQVTSAGPVPTVVVEALQSPSIVLITSPVAAIEIGSAQSWASIVIRQVEAGPAGPPGPSGGAGSATFETVSQNLAALPKVLSYSAGVLTTVIYAIGGGAFITKTFNYLLGELTSIVLSGAVPGGVALTKVLSYQSGELTGVAYS